MSSNANGLNTIKCLQAFSAEFLSQPDVRRWVVNQLHSEGKRCPYCQSEVTDERRLERWYQCERIRCKSCRHFFTSLTGTILQHSPLSPQEVYLLVVLLELEAPITKIAQVLSVHVNTVRNWQLKLQAHREGRNA
jgi:transposase-like protein